MHKAIVSPLSKVPEITLAFWVIKIFATTLGETGGDVVSMSMGLGYLLGTVIFTFLFLIAVFAQVRAEKFRPFIYWTTIIATTTVGTTLADFADRSLAIGYSGGTMMLVSLLILSFFLWHKTLGSVSMNNINDRKTEIFYWVTIMLSQTLGTALGDWTADTAGLGYTGGVYIFGGLLLMILAAYKWSKLPKVILFWMAFILTRPFGAVVGDFLDKPLDHGGLALSRYSASLVLLILISLGLLIFPQRAAKGVGH